MSKAFVVVGGGMAGAKTVEALRSQGFDGRIALICEEALLPYERPPLSKEYLAGQMSFDQFTVHNEQWYRDNEVDLQLDMRVVAIHNGTHEVELSDGSRMGYDKLALATGSRSRHLPIPGAESHGVYYLRRRSDADQLRTKFSSISELVVIGGGWIGMEAAAVARQAGVAVTIVEGAGQPLQAALGAELGTVFADLHRQHGVQVRTNTHVSQIDHSEGLTGVRLDDGTQTPAQAVLIAVGARPEVTLAQRAGLDVGDGVLVDAGLTTSDPDIVAVGDIANVRHPVLDARVRVEHWETARNQPPVAAATMLGTKATYTELPFFFTDQYDLGMEFHGYIPQGSNYRVVTRGDTDRREFVAFWLDERDRVLAGMNVNVWDVGEPIKDLIRSANPVDPHRLADTGIALGELETLSV